jgi:hypothetical protein
MDDLLKIVVTAAVVIMAIVYVRRDVPPERAPAPGWVCWDVKRVTSAGTSRARTCEPAVGWHIESWPGGVTVSVPDHITTVHRFPVRGDYQ